MSDASTAKQFTSQWAALRDTNDELTAIVFDYAAKGCCNKALGRRFRTTSIKAQNLLKDMRDTSKACAAAQPPKPKGAKRKTTEDEEPAAKRECGSEECASDDTEA